ncbi:MAG TPA: hypothetical protein VK642_04275 [Burkholderiales bacterium]|nr:hypothetical protein [Burkholderiales bacterium]
MPDKVKKRIYMFYAAGVVNLLIGTYVLFFGRGFLPEDKITMLILFFLGFAAVDFWMPIMIKKKWEKDQAAYDAQQRAQGSHSPPQA